MSINSPDSHKREASFSDYSSPFHGGTAGSLRMSNILCEPAPIPNTKKTANAGQETAKKSTLSETVTRTSSSSSESTEFFGGAAGSLILSEKLDTSSRSNNNTNNTKFSPTEEEIGGSITSVTEYRGNAIGSIILSHITSSTFADDGAKVFSSKERPNKLSQAVDESSPLPDKEAKYIYGNAAGSIKLSETVTNNNGNELKDEDEAKLFYGNGAGSVKLSETANVNYSKNSNAFEYQHHFSDTSRALSDAFASKTKISEYDSQSELSSTKTPFQGHELINERLGQAKPNESKPYKSSLSKKTVSIISTPAVAITDETLISDLLKVIAENNEWTQEEFEADCVVFKKYRIKNVRQVRELTQTAWDEMHDLIPTSKDLTMEFYGTVGAGASLRLAGYGRNDDEEDKESNLIPPNQSSKVTNSEANPNLQQWLSQQQKLASGINIRPEAEPLIRKITGVNQIGSSKPVESKLVLDFQQLRVEQNQTREIQQIQSKLIPILYSEVIPISNTCPESQKYSTDAQQKFDDTSRIKSPSLTPPPAPRLAAAPNFQQAKKANNYPKTVPPPQQTPQSLAAGESPSKPRRSLYRTPSIENSKPASIDSNYSLVRLGSKKEAANNIKQSNNSPEESCQIKKIPDRNINNENKSIKSLLSSKKLVSKISTPALSRPSTAAAAITEDTLIADLLKSIAENNEWTQEEFETDCAVFKKYRIKNVRQVRELTQTAWDEMIDLIPTSKDLVRSYAGWKKH